MFLTTEMDRTIDHLKSKITDVECSCARSICGIYSNIIPSHESLICYGVSDNQEHAEPKALSKIVRQVKKVSMLVLNCYKGKVSTSKPCINCVWKILKSTLYPKIKFVYFLDDQHELVRYRIYDLITLTELYITRKDISTGKTHCVGKIKKLTGMNYTLYHYIGGRKYYHPIVF